VPLAVADIDALRLLGYFYLSQGLHAKAATIFTALDRLLPNQPGLLRALAVTRDRLGQTDKALEALDRLAMTGEVDAQFHALRAKLLGTQGHWEEAKQAMNAAIRSRGRPTPQAQKKSVP
jgi:tetratricopeptide (TPR) repeat protein